MGRKRLVGPEYYEHKGTGRGRAVWWEGESRRERLLPGPFNSKESKAAFGRLLLEQQVAPLAVEGRAELLLVEVLDAYFTHAAAHYRGPDGLPTSEMAEVKLVVRALRETYGAEPVGDFGPRKLKALRHGWVVAKLSRGEANRRTSIVKRIFKWAASEELIPVAVHTALGTVAGLQKGRTAARETEPIAPVCDDVVDAIFPHLNRHVRGLIEFQRLTGCRPGEACAIRLCDVDRSGDVWMFRPRLHKNTHKGKGRVVAIGPKAQTLVAPFFTDDPTAYLFSAAAAVAEVRTARSAARLTPRYESHLARNAAKRKKKPKRAPAARYTTHSYSVAVSRACDLAFPPPAELGPKPKESKAKWWARLTADERQQVKAWRKAHRWHPNQLRHSVATAVRKEHGLEAAQVLLGHERADVTQIYAEKNEALAAAIAAKRG